MLSRLSRPSRLYRGCVVAALVALAPACMQGATSESPADAGPSKDVQGDAKPPPVTTDPQFKAAFAPVLDQAKTMTLDAFLALHTPADAAKPITPSYDPLKALHMDVVQEKLVLNAAEQQKLKENGFVVARRLSYPTMANALLTTFQKDLPVMVTSDAILQALHSSYDDILSTLEQYALLGILQESLAKAHAAVPALQPGAAADAKKAKDDVDFYLTVARSLLSGKAEKAKGGAAVDALVGKFLGYIAAEQMADVELFGSARTEDYSQFKPRGHYTATPELQRYFKAMMWLGRTDLRFAEFDTVSGKWQWRPRQVMAAILLKQAVEQGGALPGVQSVDDLVTLMVGPIDYINLSGLQKMVTEQGWSDPSAVGELSATQIASVIDKMASGAYGSQQIASHYLETDPFSAETTPLPPSFAMLGQRFVIDSYVFSNVVYDRVLWQGSKVQRVLPNALDAMFVLGNDQVLPLLADEFGKFPYWGALHDLRWLVDQHGADFWQGNVYNLWLDSLRQLNPPTTAAKYPFALRTPAWRDKTIHTQLASWAQLRHDTLLYAKQSYTGAVSCAHPGAYVEPNPALFAKLKLLGAVASQALLNAPAVPSAVKTQLGTFFTDWQSIMGKLELAATHELSPEGATEQDIAFLKGVISSANICGMVYTGWYTKLFFQADSLDAFKPTIADVHTNPNQGPLPGPDVLHVATSNVDLMVLTVDTCEGGEAFVGPVFRYHEVDWKKIERLSDEDWKQMLKDGKAPPPPAWTGSFAVAP
ncbi:MAG: DUF3160 domain-containing protein [Deltaproteobacteria bacterium]|nr:DUF3160 domain-containing protein [Deltaproteobacteria bacterium]